ncbi:hypothetical protein H2198_002949 [Neophaeococcomyces mojaviensis]|uniref:Uncharacterized protein n=1 Tax=Neophaeococcomyces mojaviensis TaxID=3383035 RepID=A0ACC3ACM6_9EURO|nr:hypothetical protein H2198_002949 [Knufia sp. JES_112]
MSSSSLLQPDVLSDLTILITGASSGIGRATALACAHAGAHALILLARSIDKLNEVSDAIASSQHSKTIVITQKCDIQSSSAVYSAINASLTANPAVKQIDVLINNAGLAIGAPARFSELSLSDIDTMLHTNLSGMLYVTHAVLNLGGDRSMLSRKAGTILNITSTTALEVPPFPGEAIYHTTKASQEAFTNSLRTELQETNIRVQVVRPGVVADTTFHKQRVGYKKGQYDEFMSGFEPLISEDVAEQIVWVLACGKRKERVALKAIDVVPSAQRMLYVIDKTWNERNGVKNTEMEDS